MVVKRRPQGNFNVMIESGDAACACGEKHGGVDCVEVLKTETSTYFRGNDKSKVGDAIRQRVGLEGLICTVNLSQSLIFNETLYRILEFLLTPSNREIESREDLRERWFNLDHALKFVAKEIYQ